MFRLHRGGNENDIRVVHRVLVLVILSFLSLNVRTHASLHATHVCCQRKWALCRIGGSKLFLTGRTRTRCWFVVLFCVVRIQALLTTLLWTAHNGTFLLMNGRNSLTRKKKLYWTAWYSVAAHWALFERFRIHGPMQQPKASLVRRAWAEKLLGCMVEVCCVCKVFTQVATVGNHMVCGSCDPSIPWPAGMNESHFLGLVVWFNQMVQLRAPAPNVWVLILHLVALNLSGEVAD